MRVVAAPADHVAAGTTQPDFPVATEQRPSEEERGADLFRERRRTLGAAQRSGHPHGVTVEFFDLRAERARNLDHAAHVANARHVVQGHRLVGEQARRDERKRFVLVACWCDLAAERRAAFDDEARHPAGKPSGPRRSREPAAYSSRCRAWCWLPAFREAKELLRVAEQSDRRE